MVHSSALARRLQSALATNSGAIADRRSLAAAVMSGRGEIFYADPAYRALFSDARDLRPLLRRASRDGHVISLVEGTAGMAFVAWVGTASSAARWPLGDEAAAALAVGTDRLAVVVSAPSRSSELARRAARALDLTALEARLAEALMFAPTLEVAAASAGVGRETARDALRRINVKAGVRRTPELIARLISLMCEVQGDDDDDVEVAQTAFGLTFAEARAAAPHRSSGSGARRRNVCQWCGQHGQATGRDRARQRRADDPGRRDPEGDDGWHVRWQGLQCSTRACPSRSDTVL